MRLLFGIALLIFSIPVAGQEINDKPDTTSKPYFESITLSSGLILGPTMRIGMYPNKPDFKWRMIQIPLRLQFGKQIGKKKLINVSISRNAIDNSYNKWKAFPRPNFDFDLTKDWIWTHTEPLGYPPYWTTKVTEPPFSNWTFAINFQHNVLNQRFSAGYSIGYGFEYGGSWYLGTSLLAGIQASYKIAPHLRLTFEAGARSMYGGFFKKETPIRELDINDDPMRKKLSRPYQPWEVYYGYAGLKWLFNERIVISASTKKYFKIRGPSKQLGFGLVYTISYKDNRVLHRKIVDEWGIKEFNTPGNIGLSYPYIHINSFTPNFMAHNLGIGYKKWFEQHQTLRSFRIFYQYDFPILKSKKRNSLLYSGLNVSSYFETSDYKAGVEQPVQYASKNLVSSSNLVSLSLPFGYKKEISNSGIWSDLGLNFAIVAYGYGKYNFIYHPQVPIPSSPITLKGSMNEFIFYPNTLEKINSREIIRRLVSIIYFKILFI